MMEDRTEVLEMAADIVAAYVAHNTVPATELPKLLEGVHGVIGDLSTTPMVEPTPKQDPAVPIKKSVTPDYIICLEDGKKLKVLKRHLRVKFDLSPEEYRAKWGLPVDYPMVAPNYAEQRSALAKKMGLGRRAAE